MTSVDFVTRVINFWEALIEKRKNSPCKKLVVEYDVAGGNYTLVTETVEGGETEIITSICAYVDGGSPDLIRVGRAFMRNLFWQESKNTPADGELVCTSTTSVLQGGDYIVAYFENVPAGSDIYLMTSCGKALLPFLYPRIEDEAAAAVYLQTVQNSGNVTNPNNILDAPDGSYATIPSGTGWLIANFGDLRSSSGIEIHHNSEGETLGYSTSPDDVNNCGFFSGVSNVTLGASPHTISSSHDIRCLSIEQALTGSTVDIDAVKLLQ